MAISQTDLNKIYLAYFGRPVDASGLTTFSKMEIGNVIGAFDSSKESQELYGTDPVAKINAIYKNLFGREAEPEGLKGWLDRLATGEVTPASAALEILNRAQNSDAKAIENKIAAADAFTTELLKNTGSMVGYSGNEAAKVAREWLAKVNAESKMDEVTNDVNAAVVSVATAGAAAATANGQTFTLTASTNVITGGADLVNGTAGNDTIRAAAATSLDSTDVIDGGAGFDTLIVGTGGLAAAGAPLIKNVERIDNGHAAAETLALANVTGLEQLWTTAAGLQSYTDAKIATTFGFSGSAARSADLDFTNSNLAGASTLKLATTMTGGSTATVTFGAGDAALIENLTVDATGNSVIALGNNLTALETVTVTGAGVVSFTGTNATTLTAFDASANTGGVTFTSGALAAPATVKGGSGNDTLNFGAATAGGRLTIDAGAGNDIITGGAGRDVINGGEGNDVIRGGANGDTLTGGAGDDVFSFTALTDSQLGTGANAANTIDMISDFNVGNDTISFAGIDIDTATAGNQAFTGLVSAENQILVDNAVNGLAAGSTLAQAVAAVEAQVAEGQVAWFQYGGNTYVFADGTASDMVIGLTGNVALNATDFQF